MDVERHIRARVYFENAPQRRVCGAARPSSAAGGEYQSADDGCRRGRSDGEHQFLTAAQRLRLDTSDG